MSQRQPAKVCVRQIKRLLPLTSPEPWRRARMQWGQAQRYRKWSQQATAAGYPREAAQLGQIADAFLELYRDFWQTQAGILRRCSAVQFDTRWLDGQFEPMTMAAVVAKAVAILQDEIAQMSAANAIRREMQRRIEGAPGNRLVAALLAHHVYSDGACHNFAPITSHTLIRTARVQPATAYQFWWRHFRGYEAYRRLCVNRAELNQKLQKLATTCNYNQQSGGPK